MESNSSPRDRPSMAGRIVWVFFSFVMWGWAILGPLAVLIGTLSFFTDVVSIEGATTNEKLKNLGLIAFLGMVGLSFVWLRRAGFLKFGDESP